jgi:hypothetical protein
MKVTNFVDQAGGAFQIFAYPNPPPLELLLTNCPGPSVGGEDGALMLENKRQLKAKI